MATIAPSNFSVNKLPSWQQPLAERGILTAALAANWQPYTLYLHNQSHEGWRYPLFGSDDQPYSRPDTGKPTQRWKNLNSAQTPKYWWLKGRPEGCPTYYLPPGARDSIRETGIVYLASGEPDVLTYFSAGICNTLCWLTGEAAPPASLIEDLHQLGVKSIRHYPDLDETGYRAARSLAERLYGCGIEYIAYSLPGDLLGTKGDINKLWQAVSFEPQHFEQQLHTQPILLRANIQCRYSHNKGEHAMTDAQSAPKHKELPVAFYDAVERALGVSKFDSNGWSDPVTCPMSSHEHDEERPAAGWNRDMHIFRCFKCGDTLLAKDVGAALDIDWKDFVERPTNKPVKKPAAKSATKPATSPSAASAKIPAKSHTSIRHMERTNMGNVERLLQRHGENMRFIPAMRCWATWDGTFWNLSIDEHTGVSALIDETVLSMKEEAKKEKDPYLRDMLVKYALKCQDFHVHQRMSAAARKQTNLWIDPAQLDREKSLLGCTSGIVDLKTGKLTKPKREYFITRKTPIAYDPDAKAPTWEAFLRRVTNGDEALMHYIQKAVGYTLTGETSEKCFFIVNGKVDNGKTVFLRTLQSLLGESARYVRFHFLLKNKWGSHSEANYSLSGLSGVRCAVSEEVGRDERFDDALIKQLTGCDKITARPIYGKEFSYIPVFKLWLGTNHLPSLESDDPAIWRRVRVIPFNVTIPRDEQDRFLDDKLKAELPGILAWALRGAVMWYNEKLDNVPQAVQQITSEYRREQDSVEEFLQDACDANASETHTITVNSLFEKYSEWCKFVKERSYGKKRFVARMEQLGYERSLNNRGHTVWKGIALLEEEDDKPPAQNIITSSPALATDTVGIFLDVCRKVPDASISIKRLYEAYKGWCDDNDVLALGKLTFNEQLRLRGIEQVHMGNNVYGWQGLTLDNLDVPPDSSVTVDENVAYFLNICKRDNPKAKISIKELYEAYIGWCDDNGIPPITKAKLDTQIEAAGIERFHMGQNRYGWRGLRL